MRIIKGRVTSYIFQGSCDIRAGKGPIIWAGNTVSKIPYGASSILLVGSCIWALFICDLGHIAYTISGFCFSIILGNSKTFILYCNQPKPISIALKVGTPPYAINLYGPQSIEKIYKKIRKRMMEPVMFEAKTNHSVHR